MTGRPRPRAATTGTEAPARPAVLVLDAGDLRAETDPGPPAHPREVPVRSLAPAARVRPGAVRGVRLPAGPNVVPFPPRTSHSSSRNRCTRSAPGRSTRRLEQVAVRFALARIAPAASRSRTRPLQSSQAFISDRSGSTPGAPPRTVRRARPRCSPARAAGTGRDRSARERLDADGAVAGPRRGRPCPAAGIPAQSPGVRVGVAPGPGRGHDPPVNDELVGVTIVRSPTRRRQQPPRRPASSPTRIPGEPTEGPAPTPARSAPPRARAVSDRSHPGSR